MDSGWVVMMTRGIGVTDVSHDWGRCRIWRVFHDIESLRSSRVICESEISIGISVPVPASDLPTLVFVLLME